MHTRYLSQARNLLLDVRLEQGFLLGLLDY
jgi:hypothetical protein